MVAVRRDRAIKKKFAAFASLGSCSRELSAFEEQCKHSTVFEGRCRVCGKEVDDAHGVAFDYILPGLRYSHEEIVRIKMINSMKLFQDRKLHLVLDLDHTLIHAQRLQKLTSEEKLLEKQAHGSNSDLLNINGFLMKLRPYVHTFLEEASTMYEIYICTMGTRQYAEDIAKILDPEYKYFNSRIISREDFKDRDNKNLNLVLGHERGIVIVDDTDSVWNKHKDNLIPVERYEYFKNPYMDYASYYERKTDESETNGTLINVLRVLKTTHELFFNALSCRDVRTLLGKIRSEVLMGCALLFNDDDYEDEDSALIWHRAEEMGAACTTIIDSSVTHVISSKIATEHCQWAEQENKFVVHPQWIDFCYYLWRRQSEEEYLPLSL